MPLVGGANPGQIVSPPEFAEFFFDRLAAASVVLQSGVRVIPTEARELRVPRLTSDVAANWTDEAAEIAVSDPAMDSVVAIPRKLAVLTYASNELFDDSTPELAALVGTSVARSMALKLDKGLLEGSGTAPEIRGLKNQSGIQTLSAGTNGGAMTIDLVADALGLLNAANAGARRAIYMPARTWTALSKVKDSTGSNRPVLMADTNPTGTPTRAIYGTPVYVSNQLSQAESQGTGNNLNSVYVVDLDSVVVVRRRDLTVVRDSSWKFSSDQTAIRATSRFDLVLSHPEGVVRITGVQ
jgi:HK97 family phage major capsid protein